jgi:hypothetical protein
MDDETNREYARAAQPEDLVALCKALNQAGAKYVVIGGYAVILHGYVRGTKDIDLLIDSSPENIQKIKKGLSCLPDNAAAEMQDDEVEKYTVVRIADEFVIDLLASACGVDFNEAIENADFIEIDGIKIPVANKKILIKTKQTVRPHDQTDINFLQRLIEEESRQS